MPSTAVQFITYKNEDYKFQISYPKDWRTSPSVNGALWKIAKTLTNELATISISVAKYTGNDASFLQKMLDEDEIALREMRRRFPDGKTLAKGNTFLGSFPAIFAKRGYTAKNFNAEIPIIMIQITCIRENLLYLVSFETNEGSYQKTYSQFQAVISTFNFR